MARYIDEENLIRRTHTMAADIFKSFAFKVFKDLLMSEPTADVQKVTHGRWIDKGHFTSECSCCGSYVCNGLLYSTHLRYCPNCGAKMDGKEN